MSKRQSIAAQDLLTAGVRVKLGIHLHEESGQLFEVSESHEDETEVKYLCFLSENQISSSIETMHLIYLALQDKITYIGDV